jgi:polysaccharide biosynthesis protein PslE
MPAPAQLADLYRFVRYALARHRTKAALVFVAVAALAVVGTVFLPRSYYSEAQLYVRFGRENTVDPTASGSQMVSVYESRESEINSLIEILKSRAVLERAVQQLGPEYVLDVPLEQAAGGSTTKPAAEAIEAGTSPTLAFQRAVQRLERTVRVSAPRRSNIITVGCKARSPAVAQRIVATLVEAYMEEHLRVHRTPGSYQFFAEQTRRAVDVWQQAGDKLREAKDRLGIVTIEGKRRELQEQMSDVDSRLLANQAELEATQSKIASLRELIASLPSNIVSQRVAGASESYDALQAREQELAAKMQDNHPQLLAVRQQVAELRTILRQQPAERLYATEGLNPSRQALELTLLSEQSQAESLRGRQRSLVELKAQLRRDLARLNAEAVTIEELEQRVALAEANHRQYAEKLEQSRINHTLDEQQISSLSLVQPASYVNRPVGPQRAVVLAVGLLFAAVSGLGTALLAACLSPAIATVQELSRLLDLPVVGVLPSDPAGAAT